MAILTATGLLASAAPGLAAEQSDPVAPLTASSPAAPAAPTDDDPDDDPDDESSDDSDDSSGGGGWAGRNTSKADDDPGEGDESGDYADQGDPSDEDSASVRYGNKKQTKAGKAAAERAGKKAKVLQKKAQKKAASAKKSSAAKKKKKEAARKKAAKKMKQQAMRAARQAAARDAAQKRAAAQQRRAVADDEREDNPRSGGSVDSLRDAILDLTNKARRSAGCGSVRYSTQLERSAQAHANDMSAHNYMSHKSRSGKNSDQRIRATGFNGDKTGENLGEGFSSPEAVFKAWMGSPSHRRNILDCGFRILGVGYNGGYWAQHFGG